MTLPAFTNPEKSPGIAFFNVPFSDTDSHHIKFGQSSWRRRRYLVAGFLVLLILMAVAVAILLWAVTSRSTCETVMVAKPDEGFLVEHNLAIDYDTRIITMNTSQLPGSIARASILRDYDQQSMATKDLDKNICYVDSLHQSFDDVLWHLADEQLDIMKLPTGFEYDPRPVEEDALLRRYGSAVEAFCRDITSYMVLRETNGTGPEARCHLDCPAGSMRDDVLCRCLPSGRTNVVCLPECRMNCEFGFEKDQNDCPLCKCKEFTTPASPTTTSVICGPECRMMCAYGFEKDENGCSMCKCKQPTTQASTVIPGCTQECQNLCATGDFQALKTKCPYCNCPRILPPSDCPPICRMTCDNGFVTGEDGCPICQCRVATTLIITTTASQPPGCNPACAQLCAAGVYDMVALHCPGCNCPKNQAMSTTPPVPTTTSVICGPVCRMYCEFGYETDKDGCPVCPCKGPPTQAPALTTTPTPSQPPGCSSACEKLCASGAYDVATQYCAGCNCGRNQAVSSTTPVNCAPECRMLCEFGFEKDENGCSMCKCKGPPTQASALTTTPTPSPPSVCSPECEQLCKAGVYDMVTLTCPNCNCPRNPAVPTTTPVKCLPECRMFCEFGFVKDEKGCSLCMCKEPTTPACPPECRMDCLYGKVLDDNGCATCQCKGPPTAGPITTITGATQCTPTCESYCLYGFYDLAAMTCPQCICARVPPVQTTSPMLCGPLCRIDCPSGFVMDTNGCPKCECRPPTTAGPVSPPTTAVQLACTPACIQLCETGAYTMVPLVCPGCNCPRNQGPVSPPTTAVQPACTSVCIQLCEAKAYDMMPLTCPGCNCPRNQAPVATIAPTSGFRCEPNCRMFCEAYVKDINGCDTCRCVPPTTTSLRVDGE